MTLEKYFWWDGLKRDIAVFLEKCPNYQQVKAKHQKPGGLIQEIQVPTWKLEDINMDIVGGYPRHEAKMTLYGWLWID